MNDILFFPVALIAALAIIASAALPGRDRLGCSSVSGAGTNYQQVSVSGDDLCRMQAAGQADVELLKTGDVINAVRISAGAGMLGDKPERNPHFRLAHDLEVQFAGHQIRVTIEAKPSDDVSATAFEANYSAGQEGDSGWHTFRMTPDYRPYTFIWNVPTRVTTGEAVDYLAIRPIVPDKVRAVDIRSVTFERLNRNRPPAG